MPAIPSSGSTTTRSRRRWRGGARAGFRRGRGCRAPGARAPRSPPGSRHLHREPRHPRALSPLPARASRRDGRGGRGGDGALAPRVQPADRPLDPPRPAGRRRARARPRGGRGGGRDLQLQRHRAAYPRGPRPRRADRLHHRLLRGRRREARPAHLRGSRWPGRGWPRRRPPTWATSTRWTCWARGRRGSRPCSSTRAATGAPAIVPARATRITPSRYCSANGTDGLVPAWSILYAGT